MLSSGITKITFFVTKKIFVSEKILFQKFHPPPLWWIKNRKSRHAQFSFPHRVPGLNIRRPTGSI